jgi:cysteine synthase
MNFERQRQKETVNLIASENYVSKAVLEAQGSTGNFGISLAYYAKISGLTCHVWLLLARSYPAVINLLRAFSTEIYLLDYEPDTLYARSSEEMRNQNIYDVNPGKCLSKIKGNTEIGQEIVT